MAHPHPDKASAHRDHGTLATFQRIKQWQVRNKEEHPMEFHTWDSVLTVWMMGWIGWLPAFALGADWAYPFCLAFIFVPGLYIKLRLKAHQAKKLRCDWLDQL